MPTPSPRSRNSTRKSRSPVKSKRPYTRRTGREKIGSRIGKIEKAVGEIKSLVDSHCGDTAMKTARAAAVAAAEEVLEATGLTPTPSGPAGSRGVFVSNASGFRQLAPGENNLSQNFVRRQFNTPPPLETLRPQTAVTKSRKAKKLAAVAANAAAEFEAVANGAAVPMAAAAARPKSMGPKLWNEFLKNYMRNQEAAGRKLTRLEAMAEAGPNYRRKHGLPEPKPKKPKTLAVPAGANAVQVAPLEAPAVAKTPLARTKKAPKGVRILAPGSLAAKTPGRLSPALNLNNGSGAANRGEVNSPTPTPNAAARTPNGNANAAARTPNGNANAAARTPNGNAGAAARTPNRNANAAARTPNGNAGAAARTPNRNANAAARTPNGNANATTGFPLSPATYGYEDEGVNEATGQRKVVVGGDEYYLGENGSLIKRAGDMPEEWVGYLEPGGEIRYTNSPNEA
jgi:hypothetical protein